MTNDAIKAIIGRLMVNADEAVTEARNDREDEFKSGRSLAYYEMLDILKIELSAHGENLKDFGLDKNLEETFI